MKKAEVFEYKGSCKDFLEGSYRYYVQLAVNFFGSTIRDKTLSEMLTIGQCLHQSKSIIKEYV